MKVVRALSGQVMTSLEMAGIQISVLKVTNHPERLKYLDAPTDAPAWPRPLMMPGRKDRFTPERSDSRPAVFTISKIMKVRLTSLVLVLLKATKSSSDDDTREYRPRVEHH